MPSALKIRTFKIWL